MTRPVLRRKRPKKRPRMLSPLQRLIVAKEIAAGGVQKEIAARWRISRAYIHRIFDEHLRYEIVWKERYSEEAETQETGVPRKREENASARDVVPLPRVREPDARAAHLAR